MTETHRLFIAIAISPTLLRFEDGRRSPLANVLRQLSFCGRSVKPTEPGNLHITLKFLGATRSELLPDIHAELTQIASRHSPFSLALRGLGVFPDQQRPAVCWAGVSGAEPLLSLAADIESRVAPLGFPTEKRPLHPHLTLARIRSKPAAEFFELIRNNVDTSFGTDTIKSVVLMRSSWPETGLYEVVHQALLQP